MLRDMPPQTPSVKAFTRFGHWNQDKGVLEGEPDWKSISDVIEQELQKCVDQSAIHFGLDGLGNAILGEQNAMASVKTSCPTLISQMSLNTIINDLLGDCKGSARSDGAAAPSAAAAAVAADDDDDDNNDNDDNDDNDNDDFESYEFESIITCSKRLFHEAPDLAHTVGGPADATPAAPIADEPAPATAEGRRKKRVRKCALSHEQWIAKLERLALGAD